MLIHVVDVSGSEGRDPIEDFDKINAELAAYSESLLRKPMLVAANKIYLLPNDDDETLDRFTDYVESKGYKVFPLSAPISIGTEELLKAALEALARAEEEPDEEVEIFDFEKEDNDPDYRTIYVDEEDEDDTKATEYDDDDNLERKTWRWYVYATLDDGTVTRSTLEMRPSVKAGQLKIRNAFVKEDGEVGSNEVDVSVTVKLDWKPGLDIEVPI